VVSTDAHMLSCSTLTDVQINEDLRVVVPAKELSAASTIIESNDVKLSFYDNFLKIYNGSTYIYIQLIDAIFPNYKQVVPQSHNYTIEIDRDRLSGALRRISNFTNTRTNQIKLILEKVDEANRMTIGAQDLDMNSEGYETFEVHSDNFPTAMNIGFNVKMLMAAVESYTTQTVTLLMTDPNKAAIIKHETDSQNFVLIMPVTIANMPIPTKRPTETKKEFFVRCMRDDKVISEFPNTSQRAAVCYAQAEKTNRRTRQRR